MSRPCSSLAACQADETTRSWNQPVEPFRIAYWIPGRALEEEQRSTLVGDLVAGIGTVVVDPPEGDMDDYLGSLARLSLASGREADPRSPRGCGEKSGSESRPCRKDCVAWIRVSSTF